MDLSADSDKTNNTTTKQNLFTKEEITDYLISIDAGKDRKNIPYAFWDKNFDNLIGDVYKNIAEQYRKWDFKKPLVSAILSNQNGIGKTHLAIGALKSDYEEFYKNNENKNYEIYLKRDEMINRKLIEIKSEINENEDEDLKREREYLINMKTQLFDNGYYGSYPTFIRYYNSRFFIPERKLLNEFKECMKFNNETSEEDVLKKYTRYDLLVIDDVFSSRESNYEFSRSKLLSILDERLYYTMKPTIITSNLTLDEIATIDTRIASRIDNSMLIQINSKQIDYRGRE